MVNRTTLTNPSDTDSGWTSTLDLEQKKISLKIILYKSIRGLNEIIRPKMRDSFSFIGMCSELFQSLPSNHREDAGCLCEPLQLLLVYVGAIRSQFGLDRRHHINNLSKILKGTRERNTPNKCLSNISLLNVLWFCANLHPAHRSRQSYFCVFNKKTGITISRLVGLKL